MSAAIERPASKWLRGYRLYLLTAAFTLADFMTAIDDSILGE
jgi:hypothetical protein